MLVEDGPNPVKVTAGIFQFIKDNSDLCIVTLGPYGDKLFLLKLLNIGQGRPAWTAIPSILKRRPLKN